MQIITIFVTETLMKEYDIDRDLWLIAYFRCRQIDRNCVVPYVFPSIHIYFFWKKKGQPGRKPYSQVIWPGAPWPRAATVGLPSPTICSIMNYLSYMDWYQSISADCATFSRRASSATSLMSIICGNWLSAPSDSNSKEDIFLQVTGHETLYKTTKYWWR